MAFLDHIRVCNEHDPTRYLPFLAADDAGQTQRVGWVGRAFAERLARFDDVFVMAAGSIALRGDLAGFDARSAAMAKVTDALRADGTVTAWRDEFYAVAPRFGATPLLRVERAAAPLFGVTSLGVHLNGIVRAPDGLKMWVSRRSAVKATYPNELDNLCAGGISFGHGVFDTLVKESGEEASVPPQLATRARPASAITYCCERDGGLRPDILFVYDLELPADFTPRPNDGESAGFELWPIERVMETVRGSFDFKFNCNLVIIDFLIREGLIGPDEPDYLALVAGLRRWVGGAAAGDMIEFGGRQAAR
jgi:hypothetical protein